MRYKPKLAFLLQLLLLVTLGCQTLSSRLSLAPSTPTPPSPTATFPLPSATATPPPTIALPTPTPSPAFPSTTPTPQDLPLEQQLQIFEELWRIVRDEYLYPDYNGVDWEAIGSEYRQRIRSGLTSEEFYQAMDEMLSRLNDDHSVFLSPQEVAAEEAEFSGNLEYVGVGVLLSAVPERERATIILTFPNSPAAEAGLQAHDSILSIDGQPILDETGAVRTDLLLGEPETTLQAIVQTPGESPRTITLVRRRISGSFPVPYEVLSSPKGKRIGYVLLASLLDSTIDNQVEEALRRMSTPTPLDGLILDNRYNSGGTDPVARGVLSFFTSGRLGYFVNRNQERRWFAVRRRNIAGSASLPLVVLIGPNTVSFGEIISGVLKERRRAYLIGMPTEGNIELLWSYDFADGSRAWIARETFVPVHNPNQDWEKTGIQPDLPIESQWDEVTLATDPAILAALEYLDRR